MNINNKKCMKNIWTKIYDPLNGKSWFQIIQIENKAVKCYKQRISRTHHRLFSFDLLFIKFMNDVFMMNNENVISVACKIAIIKLIVISLSNIIFYVFICYFVQISMFLFRHGRPLPFLINWTILKNKNISFNSFFSIRFHNQTSNVI